MARPVIAGVAADRLQHRRPPDRYGRRARRHHLRQHTGHASWPTPALVSMPSSLRRLGAALRASQMTGALGIDAPYLDRATRPSASLSVAPISKFQAVQHNLAQSRHRGRSRADRVRVRRRYTGKQRRQCRRPSSSKSPPPRSASAKPSTRAPPSPIRSTARSASPHEHILQRFSRRAWGWRDDFGSESRLGQGAR